MTDTAIRSHLAKIDRLRQSFMLAWNREIKRHYEHCAEVEQAAAMVREWNLFRRAADPTAFN